MPPHIAWTHPLLLWGLAALLVPLLVHLLLRARPRRVRFPALALLRPALLADERARRVHSWLLLATRCAVLACATLLLAGPTCRPAGRTGVDGLPVGGVLLLDDSVSLSYRPAYQEPTTLLDLAREAALATAADFAQWPPGSRIAVVTAGQPRGEWLDDAAAAARVLRAARGQPPHAASLAAALHEAVRLFRAAPELRPALWVFTDGAASAWRGVNTDALAGIDGAALRVSAVGPPPQNVGLGSCNVAATVHPENRPIPLVVPTTALGTAAECRIGVQADGVEVARSAALALPPGDARALTLQVPPLPAGPHGLTVTLEPADLLAADQVRYVALQTGPRPAAWLVAPDAPGLDQPAALMIRNLLAPEVLAPLEQRVELRVFAGAAAWQAARGALADPTATPPALLVLLAGTPGDDEVRELLRRTVERGATLLLVPSSAEPPDWPNARTLLSESVPTTVDTDSTFAWDAAPAPPLTAELLAEWARCHVARCVWFDSLLPGVQIGARLANGQPAVLVRQLGRGEVWLLATSPDPRWSELGTRAGGLLTWLHALVARSQGPPAHVANWIAGHQTSARFAALANLRQVELRGPGTGDAGRWIRLEDGAPREPWPTALPGLYRASTGERSVVYAVNWPPEETDLAPITAEALRDRLGVPVELMRAAEGAGARRGWRVGLSVTGLLGLLLVVLLTAELVLATRPRGGSAEAETRGKKEPA